jgi:hypothetical protein
MNNKFVGVASLFAVGAGLVVIPFVSAQVSNNQDNFVSILAEKIGVEETTVQTAIDSTRDQIHEDREAQRTEDISTAVEAGKLTQRQSDILKAMHELMEEKREKGDFQNGRPADFEALKNMTQEDRQAYMQEKRAEKHRTLVSGLNEKGLNTTLDEVSSARDAAKDARIFLPMGGNRTGRGGMMR